MYDTNELVDIKQKLRFALRLDRIKNNFNKTSKDLPAEVTALEDNDIDQEKNIYQEKDTEKEIQEMKKEMKEIEEEKTKFKQDSDELQNELGALPEHVASEVLNEVLERLKNSRNTGKK